MPPDFPAAPTTHAARRPSVLGAYSTVVLLLGSLMAARRLRSGLALLLTFAGHPRPAAAILVSVAGGRIQRVFVQVDPRRLGHLGLPN